MDFGYYTVHNHAHAHQAQAFMQATLFPHLASSSSLPHCCCCFCRCSQSYLLVVGRFKLFGMSVAGFGSVQIK